MAKPIEPDSLGFLSGDIARLMRAAFAREVERAEIPITSGEARVLVHMSRCGAARQHILADRLGLAPMSVTGFLDRLETAGFVARGTDPADRRAKIVTLTPAAHSLLLRIAEAAGRARDKALDGIPEADYAQFRAVALRLRANLETARNDAACAEAKA